MTVSGYTSFEYSFYSARMNGLGGAYVAVSDDYYSALSNPAGLAKVDKIGMAFSYGIPFWGFDDEIKLDNYFFTVAYPNPSIGCFNVYYTRLAADSLYYENIYALNYGMSLNQIFKDLSFAFHLGVGLKMLNKSYQLDERTANDPVFASGTSKSGFGMDFGFLISPFREGSENNYSIGVSINNINEPDMGMTSSDVVYRRYNLGFAYHIVKPDFLKGSIITPSAQIEYSNGASQLMAGMEIWVFKRLLGLRGGWNKNEFSTGLSFNYKIARSYEINFDYSFSLSQQLVENYGTHNFALAFKFLKLKI